MNQRTEPPPDGEPIVLRPVGYVRSERQDPGEHVHGKQGWDDRQATIRLLPEHAGKLQGLTGYSHLIVLYWVHRWRDWRMPRRPSKPPGVKVFATRMPVRPNPIGFCVAELVSFDPHSGEIVVRNLDACDGSPVFDLKPYLPFFDALPEAFVPDWVSEGLRSHFGAAHEHPHPHPAAADEAPAGQ